MTFESTTSNNNLQALENRNFLMPHGFLLICKKVMAVPLFCVRANIPVVSCGSAQQSTRLNKIPHVADELNFENLVVEFLVDENLKNYIQVYDWMRYMTGAVSVDEIQQVSKIGESIVKKPPTGRRVSKFDTIYSETAEITLQVLSSNYNPVASITYHDAFPVSLGSADFDTRITNPGFLSAGVAFEYTYFDIRSGLAAKETDSNTVST